MSEFSPEDIIAYRFTQGRRKGYDTLQVDSYLERLAVHVGHLQEELARHQATERTALEVLQHAQVVADETVAAAQREAETLRRHAGRVSKMPRRMPTPSSTRHRPTPTGPC